MLALIKQHYIQVWATQSYENWIQTTLFQGGDWTQNLLYLHHLQGFLYTIGFHMLLKYIHLKNIKLFSCCFWIFSYLAVNIHTPSPHSKHEIRYYNVNNRGAESKVSLLFQSFRPWWQATYSSSILVERCHFEKDKACGYNLMPTILLMKIKVLNLREVYLEEYFPDLQNKLHPTLACHVTHWCTWM